MEQKQPEVWVAPPPHLPVVGVGLDKGVVNIVVVGRPGVLVGQTIPIRPSHSIQLEKNRDVSADIIKLQCVAVALRYNKVMPFCNEDGWFQSFVFPLRPVVNPKLDPMKVVGSKKPVDPVFGALE